MKITEIELKTATPIRVENNNDTNKMLSCIFVDKFIF